jgi:SAM-dependent methyltransferase
MCPTAGYVGIDIQEYNVDAVDAACADELLFVRADRFVDEARERIGSRTFDLVILKHVLEHSSEPMRLVDFVCDACCTGGKLYLAFPSEESISLPPAEGTLNFFDDSTHIYVPAAREVVNRCLANGLRPKAIHRRYRNLPLMLLGAVMFPYQVARRLLLGQYLSTPMMWSLYGFETVLIFEKR